MGNMFDNLGKGLNDFTKQAGKIAGNIGDTAGKITKDVAKGAGKIANDAGKLAGDAGKMTAAVAGSVAQFAAVASGEVSKAADSMAKGTVSIAKNVKDSADKVDLFNSKLRAKAVEDYNNAVERYENVSDDLAKSTQALYDLRKIAIVHVKYVEQHINQLANTPKEFAVELHKINTEVTTFENKEDEIKEAEKQAKAAEGGSGAGATLSALGIAVATMGPTAAMGVATTFGVASTGTAISALSGAAANSAALAWLGGGALAAGGGGMSVGTAFLGLAGPVGWTIAGVAGAAAIGSGIYANNNGPADLLINGKPVQVKFYANLMNELKTSAEYRSMDMMFSKDHMDVFRAVMHGDKEVFLNGQPLTSNQVQKIKQIIEEESNIRGLSWDKWMQSSVLKYDQVQREAIDRTFTEETDNIKRQTSEQKSEISNKANTDKAAAYHKAQPNLGEANKAAGVGAAIQGGLNFGIFVYQKHEEGKEIWQFTAEDWKEGGVKTAEGAFKGGFSGYAIYGLTNVCHLSAPSAGAIASGTFGLIDAVMKFRSGEIDDDGFLSLVTINALDATGAAVGAAIGQTLIPVPVVGALIGSIVASNVLGLGKNILSARERAIIAEYQRKADLFVANLDVQYAQILETLLDKYRKLGELQTYAFNLDLNIQLRFAASVDLARFIGVSETEILHNEAEIDDFFL